MKYLFILGRNPELAITELTAYFQSHNNSLLSYSTNKNSILAEFSKPIEKNAISHLGGTISIGEVLAKNKNINEVIKQLDKTTITQQTENKFNYVFLNFTDEEADKIKSCLKSRFKEEKYKAIEKNPSGILKLESGKIVENIPSNSNIQEQYFLFKDIEYNFGRIIEIYNSKEQEKRDMSKPVRREELAIPPRLAKIMINLSQIKENQTLLDPFCGIGVILQEALIQGINVIGIDKDPEAIKGAKNNIEWLNIKKENYKLINDYSTKVKITPVNSLVTEPDLGQILREIPTQQQAKQILNNFEDLIIKVLNNLKHNVKGKIVFTSPLIKIKENRYERSSVNIEKITKTVNLKLINKFTDSREDQIVARNIFVLEK
ncbi:MAG: DNA methyltransferase [Nanoarchaeota archaeon]